MARQVGLYRGFRGLLTLLNEIVRSVIDTWEGCRYWYGPPIREARWALEPADPLGLMEVWKRLREILLALENRRQLCPGNMGSILWSLAREIASRLDSRSFMDFVLKKRLEELVAGEDFCTRWGRPRYLATRGTMESSGTSISSTIVTATSGW